MDSLPKPPPSTDEDLARTAEIRRQRSLANLATVEVDERVSWGERALPYMFALMETCWMAAVFIGLASLGFLSHAPIIPLWAPLVLMGGACWLSMYLERRELQTADSEASEDEGSASLTSGSSLIFGFVAIMVLLSTWASIYSDVFALYDPLWLGKMVSDLFMLDLNAYHIIIILGISIYCCWRGVKFSRRIIEPSQVMLSLRIGAVVMLVVILIVAGVSKNAGPDAQTSANTILLLLVLIPLFLGVTLITHALAQAAFTRHTHTGGLLGSIGTQERSLFAVVGATTALLLLVALAVGSFASPVFLAQVQQSFAFLGGIYDFIVQIIAYAVVLLVTPIFWLIEAFHIKKIDLPRFPTPQQFQKNQSNFNKTAQTTPEYFIIFVTVLKVLVPILVLLLLIWLTRRLLKRRRIKIIKRQGDTHESIWSWDLFLGQVKAFLLALWRRFFPVKAIEGAGQPGNEAITGAPAARTIREIYRALLQLAALRGFTRKKDETPHEFRQRLDEHLTLTEPELGDLTEAYTAVRYGEAEPDASDVARAQRDWVALQQKVQTQP